jgi:hypothetical protein
MQKTLDQCQAEVDKEQSYARLTITPIKEKDREYYRYIEEVEIRPYPNAWGYGGQWGIGSLESKKEVKRQIALFKRSLKEWQERGLEKIEVIRKPQMTVTEYKNEQLKTKPELTQLVLM